MNSNASTIQTEIANKVKTELQDLVNKGKIRNYNVRISQFFNRITPTPTCTTAHVLRHMLQITGEDSTH
jgi:hypothetical protein